MFSQRVFRQLLLGCLGATTVLCTASEPKNIVLIAGWKTQGPEGNGIHDHAWTARLLKVLLENSSIRQRVRVSTHLNGWPHDTEILKSADAIVVLADGRDREMGGDAPHLASPARVAIVDLLMRQGRGIVVLHTATFAPDSLADRALDWYGGYVDWVVDGKRERHSKTATQEAAFRPATPGHPVTRGVEAFTMRDEFYYDLRFRPDDARWTPIWRVSSLPSQHPQGDVVSWVVEREGGGRGFATTCGHFYDNWRTDGFRTTLLNAIAWTGHVPIPEGGVQAAYPSREEIVRHLGEPELVERPTDVAEEKVFADKPYWYQPGHPMNPAEAADIKTLPGFRAERILSVPETYGSWTALTVDSRGRLIAAAQHDAGIYRVTVPAIGNASATTKVERLGGVAAKIGWSHGLLYAFDSLYVTVSENNGGLSSGIYRLRDTDGDDEFDDLRPILMLQGNGEHGPHNMVVGPDRESLYLICGNGTRLPARLRMRRPVSTEGIDHLMPPGFQSSRHSWEGWVCRLSPDGQPLELICSGLRNSFDLAFNRDGDLFTFDSDMEWDLGAPWYRPTRICQLASGGEFGWRADAAMWPEYFEDSLPPVVNIGPASPTGIAFGYGAHFPPKYQQALYACDWTFATIHAIHLEPAGAGYRAKVEEFLGGNGLPVVDLVIGQDGAMYFIVGGRRLGSAVYRVHYEGSKLSPADDSPRAEDPQLVELRSLRRSLEQFHGRHDPRAIEIAWPHLGHPDRMIRFAARVAVESQPVPQWHERALGERDSQRQLGALLALARQSPPTTQLDILRRLDAIDFAARPPSERLRLLRIYELVLAQGGDAMRELYPAVHARLRPFLPDQDPLVARELARLLCFTQDSTAIHAILALMRDDAGDRPLLGSGYFVRNRKYGEAVRDMLESAPLQERMHHAQMLLWIKDGWQEAQREQFFSLIAAAKVYSKGGYWYAQFWDRIRDAALKQIPASQHDRFASLGPRSQPLDIEGLPKPLGPGKDWTLALALEAVERGFLRGDRNFEQGVKMFSAATCVACHRFNGQGNSVGPDLSTIGQRFTLRDILDSTVNPNKAISDQYRVTMVTTVQGQTLSGRVVSQDAESMRIATNLMRPSQTTAIRIGDVESVHAVPVSTMPTRLLDPLNEDELLDLLAYLISGGQREHPIFRVSARRN